MAQFNKHECRFIAVPEDINDPCKGCRFTGKCSDVITPADNRNGNTVGSWQVI